MGSPRSVMCGWPVATPPIDSSGCSPDVAVCRNQREAVKSLVPSGSRSWYGRRTASSVPSKASAPSNAPSVTVAPPRTEAAGASRAWSTVVGSGPRRVPSQSSLNRAKRISSRASTAPASYIRPVVVPVMCTRSE